MMVLMLASVAVMSVGISMKAYAQNATQATDTAAAQTANMTGLASGPGENDDKGDAEEGPGEDQDEAGDVDTGDQED